MWNIFKLSLIILFASVAFAQAPTEKQDQYNRFKTKIINGGFENGTSQWSASGGSFTVSTTSGDFRSGLRGGVFDASAASQTLTSSANTLSPGNNQVSCWIKTTATDYKFGIYDGTNVIVEQRIPATTVFQKMVLNYAMSASGQMRARITSQSNAAAIYIDDCFAGEADNVGNGNFATEYLSYTPAINITTNVTSSGKWRRVGDSADLELGIDFSGAPTAFSTMEIDLPSGFLFDTSKLLSSSSTKEHLCFGAWFDPAGGTTRYFAEGSYVDTNTIRVRYMNNTGALVYMSADISNSTPFTVVNGSYLRLTCNGLPIQGWNSQSVYDANINPAYWSGYHAADCLWSSTSSTYADVSAGDATCTFTEVVNNNFGTVTSYQISGNNAPGIVFTPRRAGVYEVCAESSGYGPASTGQRQGKRLYDGTNVIGQTEYQTVGTTQDVFSHKICGFVNASDLTSKTYKLQPLTASGTITLGAPSGSSLASVYWTIKQLSAVATAPLISGNVISGSASTERIERALVNCQGSSTINSQSGSWLSSIGNISTGACSLTFATGAFSATPVCFVGQDSSAQAYTANMIVTSTTAATIRAAHWNGSTFVDETSWTAQVFCVGPR